MQIKDKKIHCQQIFTIGNIQESSSKRRKDDTRWGEWF